MVITLVCAGRQRHLFVRTVADVDRELRQVAEAIRFHRGPAADHPASQRQVTWLYEAATVLELGEQEALAGVDVGQASGVGA